MLSKYKILFFSNFLFLYSPTIEELQKEIQELTKKKDIIESLYKALFAETQECYIAKNEREKNFDMRLAERDRQYQDNLQIVNQNHEGILREKNRSHDNIVKEKNREIDALKKTSVGTKAAPYMCCLAAIAVTFVIMKIYHTLYYDTSDNSKSKNALKV